MTTSTAPTLPLERGDPLNPPPALATLPPVSPLRLAEGNTGWLVTGHAETKAVLADPRFSADRSRAGGTVRPIARRDRDTRPGSFISMDPPEHTRYRKLLTGQFTVRRMRALEPRIEQIVAEHLDALAAAPQPADLVAEFALPVPSMVICELLGVPYADRAEFQQATRTLLHLDASREELLGAVDHVHEFLRRLVSAKRAEPGDDLISGLIGTGALDDEELVNIAFLLLVAGHETTANMLGLGTFALLTNPDQAALLQANTDRIPDAVEELLRYLSIVHIGLPRVAREDVTLGGQLIGEGETVTMSLPAANRDPAVAENPDVLDVTRPRTHHVAFGHGIHQCLGQQLARVEMRIGFRRLLERFPTLRLGVAAREVPFRSDMVVYGVHALPVSER